MDESVKVWVKTSVLDDIVHGKSMTTAKRSIPDAANPGSGGNNQNWGWARATVVADEASGISNSQKEGGILGDGTKSVKLFVQDEDSSHDRNTIEIPGEAIKSGGVVMANIYAGDSDDEDDDYYDDEYSDRKPGECKYPDDLITLTHLHEPAVVYALRKRYTSDKIYTSTGPILLALNPFKNCGDLYSDKSMIKYRNRGEKSMDILGGGGGEEKKCEVGDSSVDEFLPPHVFALADTSFRVMMTRLEGSSSGRSAPRRGKTDVSVKVDQSILVSGESGAGKTVTTKFIMKYLAKLSTNGSNSKDDSKGGIEKQVLQSNPILESFGNARTIRNDNSSRFGKYIEIQFSKTGTLSGASIQTYLLEKVRLINQMPGERNYHIFYEILQGFSDDEFDKYFIGDLVADDFKMISMSGTFDRRDGVEDFDTYNDLRDAMNVMNFPKEEQDKIMAATCVCLHALNLELVELSDDECKIDEENEHLEAVLSLLGVTYEQLNKALCYFSIQAGKERHERSLSKDKAEKGLQGLVKAFYGALFNYLVHRVNASITVKEAAGGGRASRSRGGSSKAASIGVLDIFGFESFKTNSFEQLCINYCNETLQQQFNLFVLKNEQDEYEREGIKWSFISFPENQEVLDLIGKGSGKGIFSILDGQCRAPGTTDKTFANAIYKTLTNHTRFEANFRQVGALKFGVIHYAGPVEYDTTGFVQKNKDEIPREATELLSSSSEGLVQIIGKILEDPTAPVGGVGSTAKKESTAPAPRSRTRKSSGRSVSSSRQTVGGQFNTQLQELRAKIDLTAPHYVRCLKPNDLLVPDHFDPVIIADQLRSAGVVEAVRVSRLGYPQRYTHAMFVNRYKILALKQLKRAAKLSRREKPVNVLVQAIAQEIQALEQKNSDSHDEDPQSTSGEIDLVSVGIQVGKTKVFLRRKAFDTIEAFRSGKMVEGAVKIQATARKYIFSRDYQAMLKAIIKIQSQARSMIATRQVQIMRRNHAATILQTKWRQHVQHYRYVQIRYLASWIQKMHRGKIGRSRYEKLNRERKAIIIQKYYRTYYLAKYFQLKRQSVLTMQCAVRSHFAREVYIDLKAKAKNLAAMSGERDQLRKENASMKQKLEIMELKISAAMAKVAKVEGSSAEMDMLKSSNKGLEKEREKLNIELNNVSKKYEESKQRVNLTEESLKNKSEECEQVTKEVSELKKKIESIEKVSQEAAAASEQTSDKLKSQIDKLKVELDDSEENNRVRLEVAKSKEEVLKGEVAILRTDVEELREEIEKKNEEEKEASDRAIEAANEADVEKEAAIDAAKAALIEIHAKKTDEFDNELEKLKLDLADAKKTISEQAEQIPKMEMVSSEELKEARGEIDQLKRELDEARTQIESDTIAVAKQAEDFAAKEKEALEKIALAEKEKEAALTLVSEAESSKEKAWEKLTASEETGRESSLKAISALEAKDHMHEKLIAAEEAKDVAIKELASIEVVKKDAIERAEAGENTQQELMENAAKSKDAMEGALQKVKLVEEEKDEAVKRMKETENEKEKLVQEVMILQREKDEALLELEAEKEDAIKQTATLLQEEIEKSMKRAVLAEEDKGEALQNLGKVENEKAELVEKLTKIEEEMKNMAPVTEDLGLLDKLSDSEKEKEEALKEVASLEIEKEKALEELEVVKKEKEETLIQLARAAKEKQDAVNRAAVVETEASMEDFTEQDEALLAVNSMLRKELEEISGELNNTKKKLREEREISKKDLAAFSDALKGVDELRHSAEVMSRELQRIKRKKRPVKARETKSNGPSDDATVATVATATLDSAAKVLNRHKSSQQENPLWNKLRGLKTSFLSPVQESDY